MSGRWSVEVPEFDYDPQTPAPTARVTAASGYDYDAADLTASDCRDFAEALLRAADRLEGLVIGRDRMTNYSRLRHRTPFEPYALKRAKGTNTMWDDFTNNLQQQINRQTWLGEWEPKDSTTIVKRYR